MNKNRLFLRSILILSLMVAVGGLTLFFFQQLVGRALAQPEPAAVTNGDIITDTVWTTANSPYLITETIVIRPGAVLTIEAGVTVLGAGSGYALLLVEKDAHLLVEGTAESPVTFSS
jgi:hypothetical protein